MAKESTMAGWEGSVRVKYGAMLLGEVFCVFSVIWFSLHGEADDILLSLATMLYLLVPLLLERLFHCKMSLAMYLCCLAYALNSLLGHSYGLFFTTRWWDKAVHAAAGVIFALLGYSLAGALNRGNVSGRALRLVFALCFSIALSAVWEFYEFTGDRLLGLDMQQGSYVNSIHSYLLSDTPGVVGSIDAVESVTVNGTALEGYIDIGLTDTMLDMMFESAGALLAVLGLALDKERHPVLRRVAAEEQKEVTQ